MRWRRMAATAVCWPIGVKRHALVGAVVDEVAVGEALHHRGDGAGRQPEHVGERAGVRLRTVSGEAVDGLEGLALGLGEGVVHRCDLWWPEILALAGERSERATSHQIGASAAKRASGTLAIGLCETADLDLTNRQERDRHRGAAMSTTPVPAVEGWFTTDDGAPPPRHPLHHAAARCSSRRPAGFCRNPECRGREFDEVELSRTGTVWSYTDAQYQPPPPYIPPAEEHVPFALAAVELAEEQLVILGQVADGLRRRRPLGRRRGGARGRAALRARRRRPPHLPLEAGDRR